MDAILIPTIEDLLSDTFAHVATCRVDHDCGADPAGWPDDVRLAMSLDLQQLGMMTGGVMQVRAIEHVCARYCGQWFCVRRIRYDRVRSDPRGVATARGETLAPCPGSAADGANLPGRAARRLSAIDGGRS